MDLGIEREGFSPGVKRNFDRAEWKAPHRERAGDRTLNRLTPSSQYPKSMMASIWLLPKGAPESDRTICQAIVLLFPQSYGVRHRFFNKINSFNCMMDSSEKDWCACKRGALPNWAIALCLWYILDLLMYLSNFLSRWILHDKKESLFDLFDLAYKYKSDCESIDVRGLSFSFSLWW